MKATCSEQRVCCLTGFRPGGMAPHCRSRLAVCLVVFTCACLGQSIDLGSSTGLILTGASPTWQTGFGAVNGLGISPPAGLTVLPASGGALYVTPFNLTLTGSGGASSAAFIDMYLNTPYAHPSVLSVQWCYPSNSCTASGMFSPVSTNSGARTTLFSGVTNNTFTIALGLFVSSANGTGTFSDTASLEIRVFRDSPRTYRDTAYLRLDSPATNVQTAVRLKLASAGGGLLIANAADYSMDYGTVDGLGVSSPAGLTKVAATGGVIYATPYVLQPAFSNATSSNGTLKAYVSTDFVHPSVLELRDGAAPAGPFSAIPKSAVAAAVLTNSAASGVDLTRYLGLFVSAINGVNAYRGSDNATLTFVLVVP